MALQIKNSAARRFQSADGFTHVSQTVSLKARAIDPLLPSVLRDNGAAPDPHVVCPITGLRG